MLRWFGIFFGCLYPKLKPTHIVVVLLAFLIGSSSCEAMSSSSSWTKLQGIVPPLVTPLLAQDTLDAEGTKRIIEHVIEGGVSGIFILGSTGEAPSLSYKLRRDFVQLCGQVVDNNDKKVPLLVGISDTSFTETIELAKIAKQAGASAVVLTSPYYFPCSQDDLQRYVRAVLDAIDLPLLLYNMPGLTKVWFDIETIRELSDCTEIVGVKDSSADLEYFAKLCKLKQDVRPDWSVFMGPEHLAVKAIELGADGIIPGGSNVEPRLFVSLYEAATIKQDTNLASQILKRVDAFQEIYEIGPWFIATKCACALRNLCSSDLVALPFTPFDDGQRTKVKEILDGLPTFGAEDTCS